MPLPEIEPVDDVMEQSATPDEIYEHDEVALTEVVTFSLGNRTWSLSTQFVIEARTNLSLASIPGVDAKLHGVIDYRGSIIPIFDAGMILGLSRKSADFKGVMILGERHAELGIVIDDTPVFKRIALQDINSRNLEYLPNRKWIVGTLDDGAIYIDGHFLLNDRSFSIGR